MRAMRPAIAIDPRRFGRALRRYDRHDSDMASSLSGDLRLFVTTFAAGFLFVTVFLA